MWSLPFLLAALRLSAATLTLDVFPNTVLAPLRAAARSQPATATLPPGLPQHCSARLTGALTSPFTQSLTFSALTDGTSSLRVWVDNHLLLDCPAAAGGCAAAQALPVAAGAPVALRVELTHGAGADPPALALFWQGNATARAEVPPEALTPGVPAWEAERVAMRDRLQSPAVPWQTWTQNMAAHVLMPQGLALDATLRDLGTGEELGDIVPWRSFVPAQVRPGLHALNGSEYTQFTLSRWGALDCSVNFSSTVLGSDLVWLIESAGADCARLAFVLHGLVKWGYSGSLAATSATAFTATLPGFDSVTVELVSGQPLAAAAAASPCNLTGTWCCSETSVWEDASGRVTSTAAYGTGAGNASGANNVSMYFSNAPAVRFFGYLAAPDCDTLHWLNDGSRWTRAPPPPFTPFVVRLGGSEPIVVATGGTARALNASAARALVAGAAARTSAWLSATAPPGLRDALEPLSAVLLWDTIFTPYLAPVTASSRLWTCTGGNPACKQTAYSALPRARAQEASRPSRPPCPPPLHTPHMPPCHPAPAIFKCVARAAGASRPPPPVRSPPPPPTLSPCSWDMPMCAWTWAGLGASGFPKDMAYAQLIEDAYTRTLMGFVPGYSSGMYASGDRTQPPLFGYVALQLYAQYGEAWLLQALYDPLLSYLEFLWQYRRGAGAFAGSDGRAALFSWGSSNFTGGDPSACTLRAAGYESGLDDSPMWDEAGWSPCSGGLGLMQLYDAGLTGLYLSESAALIRIAGLLGAGGAPAVATLQARFDATAAALNAHLWNESRGLYNNVHWDGTPSEHLAPTAYYPLMAGPASGAVPLARAAAMAASLASPLGMCLNASAFGPAGPFAAATSRWRREWGAPGGASDTATCASEACIADVVTRQYPMTPSAGVEAVVLNASAGAAYEGLVPLATWWSPARQDTALTSDAASPPYGDASYALQRLEGYCLPAPTHAAWPGAPATVPLTSWRLGNDTAACASPACEAEVARAGYAPLGALCHAFAPRSLGDFPCRFGAPSISRSDPQFDADGTGFYWRGRIWPATEGSLYWALLPWGDALAPGLGAARAALALQARRLADFHWRAWGAVCENAHAMVGACAEMHGQGRPGFDDPLLNWSGIGPYLSIVEARRGIV